MLSLPVQATEVIVSVVRDMLLLEAEQARQNMASCSRPLEGQEGAGLAQADVDKSRSSKAASGLKLKAVYGRDTRLLAEVQHGQRLLLFQQGQLWPIGRERDRQMRLLSLDSRCIELEIGLPLEHAESQSQSQSQGQSQSQSRGQTQVLSLSAASDQAQQSKPEFQSIKLCLPS